MLKKRTYIQHTNASFANSATFNLQTAYNATKTGDDKLSDDTVSGLATFGEIVFHHDRDVLVTLDSGEANDEILFPIHGANPESTEHRIPGGKNITFKNSSGSSMKIYIYATVREQPGATSDVLQTVYLN